VDDAFEVESIACEPDFEKQAGFVEKIRSNYDDYLQQTRVWALDLPVRYPESDPEIEKLDCEPAWLYISAEDFFKPVAAMRFGWLIPYDKTLVPLWDAKLDVSFTADLAEENAHLAALLRSANQEARERIKDDQRWFIGEFDLWLKQCSNTPKFGTKPEMPSAPTGADWLVQLQRIGPNFQFTNPASWGRGNPPGDKTTTTRRTTQEPRSYEIDIKILDQAEQMSRKRGDMLQAKKYKATRNGIVSSAKQTEQGRKQRQRALEQAKAEIAQVDFATPVLGWQRLNKAFDLTYPKCGHGDGCVCKEGLYAIVKLPRSQEKAYYLVPIAADGVYDGADIVDFFIPDAILPILQSHEARDRRAAKGAGHEWPALDTTSEDTLDTTHPGVKKWDALFDLFALAPIVTMTIKRRTRQFVTVCG
jgi:hypothetical protein